MAEAEAPEYECGVEAPEDGGEKSMRLPSECRLMIGVVDVVVAHGLLWF